MSPNPISVEGIAALFRLHGHPTDTHDNPIVVTILQALLEEGVLNENSFLQDKLTNRLRWFDITRDIVIKKYGDALSDNDLFALIDTIEFLDFMVSEDGMNLDGSIVFQFLKRNLEYAYVTSDAKESETLHKLPLIKQKDDL